MFLLFPSCSSFTSFSFFFKFFLPCFLSFSFSFPLSFCLSFLLFHPLLFRFVLLYSSSLPILIFLAFCSFMYPLPFLFLLESLFSISLHYVSSSFPFTSFTTSSFLLFFFLLFILVFLFPFSLILSLFFLLSPPIPSPYSL